jgi:Protein of unknown function (DUF3300)
MPDGRVRVARRGIIASLACIGMAGAALAQDTAPIPPPTAAALPAPSTTAAAPIAAPLTQAQLEQLLAPIALYPDPLLAQILMAATYPLEVVEAARWVSTPPNRALTGEALANALQPQNWDPSVKALVPFPRVLQTMSDQLQWTEELGNAFLAQQADVMAAVQALRREAMAAGNLKQTPQCHCVIQTSGETIAILPAEPQVVCVPVYSPVVYGGWPSPAYPPYSFPAPSGFAYAPGYWIGFEPPIELAVFGPLWGWGSVDWTHRDITVNPERYALAAGGHPSFSDSVWVHNPAHRGGVPYANAALRERFDAARVSALAETARSGAAMGGGSRGAAEHFGAITGVHGGAAASHGEAAFRGAPAFHGGTVFHGGVSHAGASHFALGAPHGGGAPHFPVGGPRGGGPHFAIGAPRGGGGPHFAIGAPHAGGGPHGGGAPHGGGPGGHHG